jgi:hypothetical protein
MQRQNAVMLSAAVSDNIDTSKFTYREVTVPPYKYSYELICLCSQMYESKHDKGNFNQREDVTLFIRLFYCVVQCKQS